MSSWGIGLLNDGKFLVWDKLFDSWQFLRGNMVLSKGFLLISQLLDLSLLALKRTH